MGFICFGLAIVALIFSIIPLFHWVSAILAGISLILAIILLLKRITNNESKLIPVIVIIMNLLILILSIMMYKNYSNSLDDISNSIEKENSYNDPWEEYKRKYTNKEE